MFITAEAARAGVEIENTGGEPLVGLRYFGPDVHANMPAKSATSGRSELSRSPPHRGRFRPDLA